MAFDCIDRRRFLLLSAAPLLAAQKAATPHARESMLQMNGYAVNAETPLALLTDHVTPNELFFVRSHWIPRTPDPKKWRLTLDGEVERPAQLTLSDLKKLPRAETTCVLQCAGNGRGLYAPTVPGVQWRYGAVGNARWSSVRVRDVLDRAGVKATAKHRDSGKISHRSPIRSTNPLTQNMEVLPRPIGSWPVRITMPLRFTARWDEPGSCAAGAPNLVRSGRKQR